MQDRIDALKARFAGLTAKPDADWGSEQYRAFLAQVGYGALGTMLNVYSGPARPETLFSKEKAATVPGNVMPIADDGLGYVYAMDPGTGAIYEIAPRDPDLDFVAADFLTFIEETVD